MPTRRFFTANQLKAIALVCMLVDHLWATLVPGREWMTCIGRIAFPIFAFELAQGYIHTRDLRGYAKRLALLAVVSEVPFDMVAGGTYFYPWHQNVAWTLPPLLGLLTALLLPGLLLTDYGTAGVVMILLFWLTRRGGWRCCAAQAAGLFVICQYMLIGQVYLVGPFEIQQECFALLALPLLWLYNGQHGRKSKPLQYAAYAFYPVHLLVLGILFMAK